MNRTLATVAFILLVGTVFGQEHAPTISQCQADERLWSAESLQAKSGTGFEPSIRNYPVNELQARVRELTECIAVDPHSHGYSSTAMVILSQANKRLMRYIQETGQADSYDAWEKKQAGKSQ
jgi:hypothetical protein